MAKQAVYDYSTTASSNSDFDGTDSSGATGKVKDGDNYARSIASHIKGFANDLGGINTVAGTGDAITITLSSAPSALVDGMRLTFNASAANTTNVTLNVTPAGGAAFGSKKVLKWAAGVETALSANDIPAANALIELIYDTARDTAAGAWMLLGSASVAAATNAQALAGTSTAVLLTPANLAQERQLGYQPVNYGITCAVGASALTITITGADGNAISATNPATFVYRNVTAATGTPTALTATSALSLVISSGSTLGAPTGSVPFKIWGGTFNDAGTIRTWAMVATTLASGALVQYPLGAWGIASSTAEGGAGAADSAQTFYTGTAVTSKAYNTLFCLHYETGLATAGTWAAVPTRIQLFDPSVPLPGKAAQVARNQSGAVATGSTVLPVDDTIPQNTEGDQYYSQAITPSSAANILVITSHINTANSAARNPAVIALFQDSTANALAASSEGSPANAGDNYELDLGHAMIAGTTSATTLKIRLGAGSAGTNTVNGNTSARQYGGALSSYLQVEEIAA